MILTCDNGIAAGEAVLAARKAGICVIVTDHHEVPFEEDEDGKKKYILPPADAVVDPKVRNPETGEMDYPFPDICGAVVAWKLADLLLEKLIPVLNRRGFQCAVIKHDGHGFAPEREGTDTHRLLSAGNARIFAAD